MNMNQIAIEEDELSALRVKEQIAKVLKYIAKEVTNREIAQEAIDTLRTKWEPEYRKDKLNKFINKSIRKEK